MCSDVILTTSLEPSFGNRRFTWRSSFFPGTLLDPRVKRQIKLGKLLHGHRASQSIIRGLWIVAVRDLAEKGARLSPSLLQRQYVSPSESR
jgi:hypothetical protein